MRSLATLRFYDFITKTIGAVNYERERCVAQYEGSHLQKTHPVLAALILKPDVPVGTQGHKG